MKKIKHCIGAISYCDSLKNPERFDVLKNTFNNLAAVKRDDNYIFLWDNGSSEDVRNFLKSCNTFDDVYFSHENLYTNGLIAALNLKARQLKADYVTIVSDDYLVYRPESINHCINFLDKNIDCGYMRILKFEYDNIHLYDKILRHPDRDIPNCQRQFNYITNEKLVWEECEYSDSRFRFFKNNYHWSEFPNICRSGVFNKIVPKEDCGVMAEVEKLMIHKYHNLGLKTGVLDGGAFTHDQRDFGANSRRVSEQNTWRDFILKKEKLLSVINDVLKTNFKEL